MQVIPAIDILNGKCVRLQKGVYQTAQIFGDSPHAMAKQFFQLGAKRLHVVDLDAAKSGQRENIKAINELLTVAAEFHATVQIGGGLRSLNDIESILSAGAAFAIVGTAAVRDQAFREQAIQNFQGQIILGTDARNDYLAVAGWEEESNVHINDFMQTIQNVPPAAIIYTDIGCDGMMKGANVDATEQVAKLAPCPVYASGGVRGEEDIQKLAMCDNIAGAIIGRAVYEDFDILKPLLENYGGQQ
ncbi:MAG: 1-(5-phosphoribosyl)-5-[(5-phosphoribosylamino)methylideneamino]imidazole-4-carboxamide isomerase [Gammaproteobacteria bacterium WSBS_2016_MAG_OTU1]